jgi:hypothetical protein
MMDYYEELGVDRSASPDEIRQAYKHLVRLLHPDHCSDRQVRPLAELQMKRLNGVLRVLTNPAEREIYDRTVSGRLFPQGSSPMPQSLPPPRRMPQWSWSAAGTATFLILVALLAYSPPSALRPAAIPEHPIAPATVPRKPSGRGVDARGLGRVARSPDSRALTPGPRQGESPAPEPAASAPAASPPTVSPPDPADNARATAAQVSNTGPSPEHRVEIAPPAVSVREPVHTPLGPEWGGVWLLVPSPHAKTNGLYPPEYIELRVTEESGILHGRYRARYHIRDQAISPSVSFQFEGQAGRDRANLRWSGAGGARGEVHLRLLTPITLEVTWLANQLSEELGLISGTATLVRKLD